MANPTRPDAAIASVDDSNAAANTSDVEEGQVSSDSDSSAATESSDSESDSEFNDGYDENLMGNAADRLRLENLSEKERETEIFKRIERRDVMRTRWEIERKLKLAKRANRARDEAAGKGPVKKLERKPKDPKPSGSQAQTVGLFKTPASTTAVLLPASVAPSKPSAHQLPKFVPTLDKSMFEPIDFNDSGEDDHEASAHEFFDPKERSKERKKNVEMNRTDDKRSSAMAMLKAKREGKQKRGES